MRAHPLPGGFSTITDPTRSRIKRRKPPARRKNDQPFERGDIWDRGAVSHQKSQLSTAAANPDRSKTRRRRDCRSPYFQARNAFPSREWDGRYQRIKRVNQIVPCAFLRRSPSVKDAAKRRDCRIRSYQGTSNGSQIRQAQICRLRLAAASGISALTELWPSG